MVIMRCWAPNAFSCLISLAGSAVDIAWADIIFLVRKIFPYRKERRIVNVTDRIEL